MGPLNCLFPVQNVFDSGLGKAKIMYCELLECTTKLLDTPTHGYHILPMSSSSTIFALQELMRM